MVEDLVLAVYEAIANAAEHAYAGHLSGPGLMWLQAHRAIDHVLIIVSDRGRWRTPHPGGVRGRGIPLMRVLIPDVDTRCDDRGTVVRLRVHVPPVRLRPLGNEVGWSRRTRNDQQ